MSFAAIADKIDALWAKHPKLQHFFRSRWRFALYLPLLFVALFAIHFIFAYSATPYSGTSQGWRSEGAKTAFYVCFAIFYVLVVLRLVFLGLIKRLNAKHIAFAFVLISAGILINFSFYRYMNYTGFKHDWGMSYYKASNNDLNGHFGLIYDIFNNGRIPDPDLNKGQYYQPKMWHGIMALWMNISKIFIHAPAENALVPVVGEAFPLYTYHEYALLESCRIIINFYGILTLYFLYRIYVRIFEGGPKLAISSAFIALTPVFWYVPFYGNNDSMSFAFALMGLLFALEYRRTHKISDIVLCAVGIGCGMMCKLSSAMVAFPVAFIFLLELIKVFKARPKGQSFWTPEMKKFAIQIAVFAAVVFPLGLGWHLYNKVVFGEPIGYVYDLEWHTGTFRQNFMHLDSNVYSPWARFFTFPSSDLYYSMFNLRYCKTYEYLADGSKWWISKWGEQDYNVWTAFLKTSLWGETSYSLSGTGLFFATMAYHTYIILGCLFLFMAAIYLGRTFLSDKANKELFILMAIIALTTGFSYAYFCAKYPVGCSSNARYALLLFIPIQATLSSGIVDFATAIENRVKEKKSQRK
ncbi:MAG: glycosyltransferase family 39 protein [Bacilli bacterium]|nr:glycosyltransferase family 39 protein [Bacilli bacterium]